MPIPCFPILYSQVQYFQIPFQVIFSDMRYYRMYYNDFFALYPMKIPQAI